MSKNANNNFNANTQQQHTNGGAGAGYPGYPQGMPMYSGTNERSGSPQDANAGANTSQGTSVSGKAQKSSGQSNGQTVKKSKKKRPISFYVAIVIAVVAIVATAIFAAMALVPDQPSRRDSNALIGQIEGKSPEEIQAELDRIVEEGMFNISIASLVEFEDGASEGEIKIENVPGNRYLMQVTIARDDNGEVVYTSGILEPNYHIQTAKLDKDLPAGVYDCTATFFALDPETEEEIGNAGAKMRIVVKN